ncbi:MAG: hypothetical protein Q8918_00475 [Bacteroidota bacterium]|nr:hypothetical protein [Bacteroidota bacterium]MDP4212442.1 hypothetical protein [Bacteroidota bacterium]MDP4248561.1 hypothetical protein [Bacteroidota bacterium]
MRNLYVLMAVLVLMACACSPTSKAPVNTAVADGLSFETAIVVNENSESDGIRAEYRWIKEHYADYRVKRQSQPKYKKRLYDIIQIQFSDDRVLALYFDISQFYGRP